MHVIDCKVESIWDLGRFQVAFVRFRGPNMGAHEGELWGRRGPWLWHAPILNPLPEPLTAASLRSRMIFSDPLSDVRKSRQSVVCGARVCLPALVGGAPPPSGSHGERLAILPGLAMLRFVSRDYSEETGDGRTEHYLLRSVLSGGDSRIELPDIEEMPSLSSWRVRATKILTTDKGAKLRSLVSKRFQASALDDRTGWSPATHDWSDARSPAVAASIAAMLEKPCVMFSRTQALCTSPQIETATAKLLFGQVEASVLLVREGARWVINSYLDGQSEGNAPPPE